MIPYWRYPCFLMGVLAAELCLRHADETLPWPNSFLCALPAPWWWSGGGGGGGGGGDDDDGEGGDGSFAYDDDGERRGGGGGGGSSSSLCSSPSAAPSPLHHRSTSGFRESLRDTRFSWLPFDDDTAQWAEVADWASGAA